jgi:hypothetical protein
VPPESPHGPAPLLTEERDAAPGPSRDEGNRRRWGYLLAAGLAVVLVVVAVVVMTRDDSGRSIVGDQPAAGATGEWLSGASGDGIVEGDFAEWRGSDVEIAGTWSDDNENMVQMWPLQPGWEYADWDGPMDVAIGAIGPDETWEEAAAGAYDDRWRASLTKLRELWADRSGTLYVRFAHESNGNWYPWAVSWGEEEAFKAAWQRFRGLQQEIYPESQLVFCVNREGVQSGLDWRDTFPGAEFVDVMSVDYYNQYPYVGTALEWQESLDDYDQFGGPKGLERHREFAESVGLPLAISEWSGNAEDGDSPVFIESMYDYLSTHGGTGPGEVLYEILFNVSGYEEKFLLYGDGVRMPESAETYQRLW